MKQGLVTWVLSFLLVSSVEAAEWTVMVYLDGDCDLETYAVDDFVEMASVGSSSDVNVVVQLDRLPGFDNRYGDWTECHRFYVTTGMTPIPGSAVADWGDAQGGREVNMADGQTVTDFVDWATTNYPANRYALILWNHGAGWRSMRKTLPYKEVCFDETTGDDWLETNELAAALSAVSETVDLIGFDACLMGMVEVAYAMRNTGAGVMVASEESELATGWPFDTILADLAANPTWTETELGTCIVNRYYESYGNDFTMCATDLSAMNALAAALDNFAVTAMNNWDSDETAVRNAAQGVIDALGPAIIAEQHGSFWPGAHGLSIYFCKTAIHSEYTPANVSLAADTQWEEFLAEYLSVMGGSWVENARQVTQEFDESDFADLYDFCDNLINLPPDDGFEENDSRPAAALVTAGNYSSLVCYDDDWYRVDCPAGATLTVDIYFTHADGDLDMTLHDPGGGELDTSVTATDNEQVSFSPTAADFYYIRVYPYDGINTYDMTVTVEGGMPPDDGFEENDSMIDAAEVFAAIYSSLACNDDDWYKVDCPEGAVLTVFIGFIHADGNLDMTLYDPGGSPVATGNSTSNNENVSATPTSAGFYYIHVYGVGGDINGYDMSITCTLPDDIYEENDALGDAASLAPGDYYSLKCYDDDYYQITCPSSAVLTVTIAFTHAAGNLDMTLYDSGGSPIDNSNGTLDSEEVSISPTTAGVYYFCAYGAGGDTNSYNLSVSCVLPPDDIYEENDTMFEAAPVTAGNYDLLKCYDDDYYRISCVAGASLTVTVNFIHADGNLDMVLYDSLGSPVDNSNSLSDSEVVTVSPTVAGFYYVCIYGVGGDTNSYDMVVSGTPPPDDIYEENDTLPAATPVTADSYGSLVCYDNDYYRISCVAGSVLTVTISFTHADGNLDVVLYDPSESPVATGDSTTDDEVVSTSPTEAGFYYVCVYGFGGDTNGYDMVVSSSLPPDDIYEENDTLFDAALLTPGDYHSLMCYDDDYYRIDCEAGVSLTVTISFIHADGNLDMTLYDPGQASVDSSTGTADGEEVNASPTEAGFYYVRVYGVGGDTNSYDLSVTCVPPDDIYEDNDTLLLAAELTAGDYDSLECYDDDYYRIDCEAGVSLTVTVSFTHADGNLDMILYGPGWNPVDSSAGAADGEEVSVSPTEAGFYYVRVYGAGGDTNGYDMVVDVQGGTQPDEEPGLVSLHGGEGGCVAGGEGGWWCLVPLAWAVLWMRKRFANRVRQPAD